MRFLNVLSYTQANHEYRELHKYNNASCSHYRDMETPCSHYRDMEIPNGTTFHQNG